MFTRKGLNIAYVLHFFFNSTPPPELYTLSLHDALPICRMYLMDTESVGGDDHRTPVYRTPLICNEIVDFVADQRRDRKSTRLNSSHPSISYAVFCLKKKKKKIIR